MRTHRVGSRVVAAGFSVAWTILLAASVPAQEAGDEANDAAQRKVMERFLSVLEKSPRRGTALDRVYGYHVERGTLDALVKRYEDRTKADPKDGPSWLLLGLVESQRGRDAAAVSALREAERVKPGDPLPPYYLGQALVLVGQPDAATEAFERALTRKPIRADLLEIYQSLGRVHQRARRSDKALAVWARLEAAFPDDTRVREQIAAALAEEDQPAQALARYERLAKEVKDEYRKVQMALEAAELKVRLGKAPEALADFEALLARLNPDSWLFKEVRRKIEEVFLRNDDLAGLAKYYEGRIERTPDDVEAMARLGRTLAHLGRAAEARRWLDKAVKLAPSRRDLRLALIEQLAQEKKFAEASAQYEELVKAEPNNPDVIRDWGRLLLRDASRPEADRKAAAAAVWKRLAEDEVKDPVAIAQAADLFRQAGMIDDTIALYRRAIALAPDAAQYREYLGEYYHQLKRPADALATWREGVGKTAAAQGRLGEVLAGFGYRKEALDPLTEAVRLAPDDFDLRLKLADLLVQLDRPLDALPEIAAAGRVAESDEQREAVLEREIHAYQGGNKLGDEIARLKADLDAGKDATAPRWTRLARYYEADGKPSEAVVSATKATAADPKSVAAWSTLGRLQESTGNLGAAADADRKLAALDRRNRADYLSAIARLEARLGRKDEALKAGRELLAAAPGNIEHHQEFAELCFNLGEVDEGLEALRRASRANPSDPKAANTLADALARQFRTEEAIELYWRSFERTKDLEGKLGLVARLTDQYLQRNQFDRLVARLEREMREPEMRRELTLCLAQAHQSAGDLGTARQELESLLASNARDTGLLTQLANLAEAEGDIAGAARYLKQVVDLSPSPEATQRLAGFYLRSGQVDEAEAVWAKMAAADQDASRAYSAIDGLLANGKNEVVLTLTERILLKRPNDWDALYREGVTLMNLNRPLDAAKRFQSILDLRDNDDSLAAIPRSRRRRGPTASPPAQTSVILATGRVAVTSSNYSWAQFSGYQRIAIASQVRAVTKIDPSIQYAYQTPTVWTPYDLGQARMAALGWLYASSLNAKDPDAWLKSHKAEAEAPKAGVRAVWDWYYIQLVRGEPRDIYDAAARLARAVPNDPASQFGLLSAVGNRTASRGPNGGVVNNARNAKVDKVPPLPPDELTLVLDGFESVRQRHPEAVSVTVLNNVTSELKRAKREKEGDALIRRAAESANTPDAVVAILGALAESDDLDLLFALTDKYDRLLSASSGTTTTRTSANYMAGVSLARAIGAKAETKDHVAILRIVDHHLDAIRRPDQVARRLKAVSRSAPPLATNLRFPVYMGRFRAGSSSASRAVTIDFPPPNIYFDQGAISVLRNAFEVYKRDDLVTDLIAHFRNQAASAPEDAKLYPTLALSYLLWWNDDKDEALREYSRAIDLAKNDVDLRMSLAELRAQRGEPAEALEVADSFEPLDQRTMQRREMLALRLSVLAGDVARARKAAERLFGLRLDSETQVQLATQMNQLGMHDLSDAVLARARRRAGGNSASLVALMIQYQKQGKADTAVQVANQVLRQGSGVRQYTPYYNENDQARTEALNVLGRSGKLKELIARAEAELSTSPNSMNVLQTLVDYYQADRQREKVKATYDRMAKLRPDDARLRFQIGLQLASNGAPAESLEHYKVAIKKDPSLLANSYYEVQSAFQQANKMDEMVKLYESVDFKSFGSNSYTVPNLIQQLMQDPQHRDQAMVLFRKAWKDLPDQRSTLMGSLFNDDLWKLPEIYDYAREACIPAANRPLASPWSGIDEIMSYNSDGTVNGLLGRLIEASSRQGKLEQLGVEVEAALQKHPDWAGGRAIRAVIEARSGKVAEARKDLEAILADDASVSADGRVLVGQELDKVEALRDVELKLYETALDAQNLASNGMDFRYGPGRKLALLYKKAGRDRDARALILKHARRDFDTSSNVNYSAYRKINNSVALGGLLSELGYPADAAKIYSDLTNDSEAFENARSYVGNTDYYLNQIRRGLARSLSPTDGPTLERTLKTLLTPRPDAKPGEPRLDLVLLCYPRELDKAGVTCVFAESAKSLKDHKELGGEVRQVASRLVEAHPDDLSALAAAAILAAAEEKPEPLLEAAGRLAKAVDSTPLEPLPVGARPNARQREEAERRLVLWVVARECLKHDATRSVGEALASRAREAAARQVDHRWSLAMLRESGQAALDRGDRPTAEAAWHEMLKLVLSNAPAAKRPATRPAAIAAAPPTTRPMPASPTAESKSRVSVIILDRFDQAAGLAKLAAEQGLPRFSLDAIRESLAGGPPVMPIPIANANAARVRNSNNDAQADPVAQRVEEKLSLLESVWSRAKAEPVAVYGMLRDVVLPPGRPNEVFFYARPLAQGQLKEPRSVGAMLVRSAVRAGKADELRAAIETRGSNPLAAAPARVLIALLAHERKDHAAAIKALDALREPGPKGALAVTGEQACLAALPALDVKETADAGARLLESALPRLGATSADEPMGGLLIRLARHEFEVGKSAEGKRHLLEYLGRAQQANVRYAGDYPVYRRKMFLARVAVEFARAGRLDDALDQLGQYADAPTTLNYGAISDGGAAVQQSARLVVALPAAERYRRLRDWTLPTADRKSVRWISETGGEPRPPAPFPSPKPVDDRGVVASSTLLIDAAREAGQLDALAASVRPLAEQKVENAPRLLAQIDLALGRAKEVRAEVDARQAELKKESSTEPTNPRRGRENGPDMADFLLARGALASPDAPLAGAGEALAERLVGRSEQSHNYWMIQHLRRALAESRARRAGAVGVVTSGDPGLAFWEPILGPGWNPLVGAGPAGARAVWVEAEGTVSHVTGPGTDYLISRAPLAGTFEFSVDAYIGGFAQGHTGYGGLVAEPSDIPNSSGVWSVGRFEMIHRPGTFLRVNAFNRMTIRVEPGKVRYLVNGHLFYEDISPSPTSPWLLLHASSERRTAFRNPTITGTPEIPRQVELSYADRLDGWAATSFGESIKPRRGAGNTDRYGNPAERPGGPDDYDWTARDGEIRGRRSESGGVLAVVVDDEGTRTVTSASGVVQSRLSYLRPLAEGDAISYEFFHEPGETTVHPSVGSLAYLVEPGGVRLHALMANTGDAPGQLDAGNVLDDPAGRRGAVALKAGDWNAATVRIKGSTLALEINGTIVYERTLDPDDDRSFGLYHDKARTSARVRKVVLRGDWPTEFGPDRRSNLFARAETKEDDRATRRARAAVVGEHFFALDAGDVARSVAGLPAAERYRKLREWVFPGEGHATIRLASEFGTTDPPVPRAGGAGSRVPVGPMLASPPLDLVDAAAEAGKLDELAEAVRKVAPGDDLDRRSRLALLALIGNAQGKNADAEASVKELRELAPKAITKETPDWQRWPELLAGSRLAARPALNPSAKALLDDLVGVIQRDQSYSPMARQIRHARAVAAMLGEAGPAPKVGDDPRRPGWVRATLPTAESRGLGDPLPTWTYRDGAWTHSPGHATDALFLAAPIRGDFELTCDLTSFGWREARISYGGVAVGILHDLKRYEVLHYGRTVSTGAIEPRLPDVPDWYPFRLVVKGGTLTAYAMGRKIHEQAVRGEGDPWLALTASTDVTAGFRNLKIVGKPAIPDLIALSAGSDLTGWLGDYYGEATAGEGAVWQKLGAEIVGRRLSPEAKTPANFDPEVNQQPSFPETTAGSKHETVLRYARPLAEDATVSYEFYYEAGRSLVHPALDRLALILDPDGVKVHRITDGRFERTGIDPGNIADDPAQRKGPPKLPLKEKGWNRVELTTRGDTLSLRLNGELVHERPIEPTNQRDFGLFHFADKTEARVRDVTLRGDWPRSLPAGVADRPSTTASAR